MISTSILIANSVYLILLILFMIALVVRNAKQASFLRFFFLGFLGVSLYAILQNLASGFFSNEAIKSVPWLYALFVALTNVFTLYLSYQVIYQLIKRYPYNKRSIEIIATGYTTMLILRYIMNYINYILFIINANSGSLESLTSDTLSLSEILAYVEQMKTMNVFDFAYFLVAPISFYFLYLVFIKGMTISKKSSNRQAMIIVVIVTFLVNVFEQLAAIYFTQGAWIIIFYILVALLYLVLNRFLDAGVSEYGVAMETKEDHE